MAVKHLYIIAGCNGAGKTTASAKHRVAKRVISGGHNIPEEVIERRYVAGLRNLFRIFMDVVDLWILFDNSGENSERIAFGGLKCPTKINNKVKYNILKEYE